MHERSANAKPVDLTFTRSSGAVGIEGRYDPRSDAALTGIVTVQFTATLAGSEGDPTDRLRVTERMVAADVLHRLNEYESLVAERDSLRQKLVACFTFPSAEFDVISARHCGPNFGLLSRLNGRTSAQSHRSSG